MKIGRLRWRFILLQIGVCIFLLAAAVPRDCGTGVKVDETVDPDGKRNCQYSFPKTANFTNLCTAVLANAGCPSSFTTIEPNDGDDEKKPVCRGSQCENKCGGS